MVFVSGVKAVAMVEESDVQNFIKTVLLEASKYDIGRGIGIDVKNADIINSIKTLVKIKLEN